MKLLVTEIFKVKIGVVPDIMKKIFEIDNGNYSCIKLQHDFLLKRDNVRSVYYGTNKATFFIGPKIWDISPNGSKDTTSSKSFRDNLKKWIPENCHHRLCKTYIHHLGFL